MLKDAFLSSNNPFLHPKHLTAPSGKSAPPAEYTVTGRHSSLIEFHGVNNDTDNLRGGNGAGIRSRVSASTSTSRTTSLSTHPKHSRGRSNSMGIPSSSSSSCRGVMQHTQESTVRHARKSLSSTGPRTGTHTGTQTNALMKQSNRHTGKQKGKEKVKEVERELGRVDKRVKIKEREGQGVLASANQSDEHHRMYEDVFEIDTADDLAVTSNAYRHRYSSVQLHET